MDLPHALRAGFEMGGSEVCTCFVTYDKQGKMDVISGEPPHSNMHRLTA